MKYDLSLNKIYVDNKESEIFPNKDYRFEKLDCGDTEASFNENDNIITFSNISKKTKCEIYFTSKDKTISNPKTGIYINLVLSLSIIIILILYKRKIIKEKILYKV